MIAFAAALALVAAAPAAVADLGWLAGSWEAAEGERWTEEYWTAPRAGIMLGAGRTGRGDILRGFEHMRIAAGSDGVPVFWGAPDGAAPVPFRLAEARPGFAAFENSAHDYPQRISYARDRDRLTATISLIGGEKARSWNFVRR